MYRKCLLLTEINLIYSVLLKSDWSILIKNSSYIFFDVKAKCWKCSVAIDGIVSHISCAAPHNITYRKMKKCTKKRTNTRFHKHRTSNQHDNLKFVTHTYTYAHLKTHKHTQTHTHTLIDTALPHTRSRKLLAENLLKFVWRSQFV